MSLYKQATGFIIHQRKFKNSSQIIEFFSKEFGKFQFIAKGIDKNKQLFSQIQLFSLSKIEFYGNSNLKSLATINILENLSFKDLLLKTSALYLNELIHLSVLENENVELLFNAYQQAIKSLGDQKLAIVLRKFEWQLLKNNGFEITIDENSKPEEWLAINDNYDLSVQSCSKNAQCQVADLQKFIEGNILNKESLKRLNRFIEKAVSISLSHRKIYSKELIKSISRFS